MGLGKTLQTLAWLLLERANDAAARCPSLIVCPTSLVENWIEEAARFTPTLAWC
jgi:SNF2 family DNA or RNA helicase